MSFFETPTPPYQGQTGAPMPRQPTLLDWIMQLFRTPTPSYLRAPPKAHDAHDDRTRSQ